MAYATLSRLRQQTIRFLGELYLLTFRLVLSLMKRIDWYIGNRYQGITVLVAVKTQN